MNYVYADSTNRDVTLYPSGSSYTLHLTTPVQQVVRVDLISAKVPNSIYNLTNGTNVLAIDGSNVSIASGFYTACGLASALNAVSTTVTVSYLSDEGKFIFTALLPFTIEANTSELQRMLGISSGVKPSVLASSDPVYFPYSGKSLIKSERVIDLSTNEFLFLDIDELRSTQMIDSKSLINETFSGSTIRSTFGMIPLDVASGSIKNFKEESDYKLSIKFDTPISKISRLSIRWIDKRGQVVNFQGFENNAFVLRFHVLEPKEPEPEPVPDVTKLEVERMIEAMMPPPPPPKKRGVPRFLLYMVIMVLLGVGVKFILGKKAVVAVPLRVPT